MNYYEGFITPESDTIFVFGSNPEGRHGAGSAKVAREQFGAKLGYGVGITGDAYALPTKDLRVTVNNGYRSIPIPTIIQSIRALYVTARRNPDKKFKVAYTNKPEEVTLSGYSGKEMIDMFKKAGPIPDNMYFSSVWKECMESD